jgi:hypothetical protein
MKLSKNIPVVFFVVALLIGSSISQGFWVNAVICIGEAGPAAIEPGFNGACAPWLGKTGGNSRFEGISSEAGRCSCPDMSIFQDQAYWNASFKGNSIPGVISLLSNLQGEISASSIYFTLSPQRIDFISPTLTSLRTVLLLI